MTNLKMLSAAELSRRKLFLLRQSLGARAGDPPEVENLLPPIPGDDVYKLQLSRQGKDCNVIIKDVQVPPGSTQGDTYIALQKDKVPVTAWVELPIPPEKPYTMILPGTETATPGPFRLSYVVNYGGNLNVSDESTFHIDTVPPNHGVPGEPATPPAEIIDGKVTREILDALGGITMTAPHPDDTKQNDRHTGYYGRDSFSLPVGVFTVGEDSTLPIEITIEKDMIELGGDGDFIFYTVSQDRVGNVGPASKPFHFNVQLTPAPSGLQPLEVPAHDDGVVDLKDAFPTTAVVIPTFGNGLPGDKARVTFDGKVQPDVPTDGTSEVIVEVPFADAQANGDGPREVAVTYAIIRDGKVFTAPTGPLINLDFTVAGPINPQPDPDLGNPNLIKLVVKGSSDDDKLVAADIGSDIDIDLTIYRGYKDGDIINLKWGETLVPAPGGRYDVDGTEDPTFKIPFKLPSAIFEATGNGIKKARYVITNPTLNGENENPSPPTDVDVYIYPVTLATPVIKNLATNPGGRQFLACSSLRDIPVVGKAAVVAIAGGGSLAADMKLTFTWSGSASAPGAPPVDDYVFEKTLQGNEHLNGFEVYLPFNAALRPITDGNGSISYKTDIDGRTHTSDPHAVRVIVIDNDQNYCPGTQGE